jgi:hypothetical protein
MKTQVLIFLLFLSTSAVFSQLQNEAKIEAVYGSEWLNRMKTDAPDLLVLMDKYVEQGFFVRTVSEGKYEQEQDPIDQIPLTSKSNEFISVEQFLTEVESDNFNPLRYRYFPTKEAQVYKLQGVNKIIYILPQEIILSK